MGDQPSDGQERSHLYYPLLTEKDLQECIAKHANGAEGDGSAGHFGAFAFEDRFRGHTPPADAAKVRKAFAMLLDLCEGEADKKMVKDLEIGYWAYGNMLCAYSSWLKFNLNEVCRPAAEHFGEGETLPQITAAAHALKAITEDCVRGAVTQAAHPSVEDEEDGDEGVDSGAATSCDC